MDILLVPFGSAGDVHPFLGLGVALQARGHRITLISNGPYQSLAEGEGLDFIYLEQKKLMKKRSLLHSVGGRWRKLGRSSTVVPLLRPLYEVIADRYVPGQTVVVASSLALGARVAHEKLGVPLATVHLYPAVFRSVYRPPVQPPLVLPEALPAWMKRAAYWLLDTLVLDPVIGRPTNDFRAELGLPPVRRLFDAWRHSPQRVIGLFPAWYGPPQPDWPPQTCLTGFPRFDGRDLTDLPAAVRTFLDEGEPPIVFTPGSAMKRGHRFFRESVAACQRLGRRGLLLTRHRDQVPAELPAGIRHIDYVPFSQVLPRAAALVHHGGIGSAAQAMAAGIPQLIVPRRHDQPDNARRLGNLGVARTLNPGAYRAPAVANALKELLSSTEVAQRCRTIAHRFDARDSLDEACELIEQLHLPPAASAA